MKTVLLIEDNFEIRENTTEILELSGYKVISVNNGNEGISLAIEDAPDLILCDIMMPGINGYEVLTRIRAEHSTANIPFIYVSASAEKRDVQKALDMGANGYVRKPFEATELLETIHSFVSCKP